MSETKKDSFIQRFLKSDRSYPVLAAISAGLYPIFFYYSNNFTLVSTWGHLLYFFGCFIVLPVMSFVAIHFLFKISLLNKWNRFVLPFLNVFAFLIFLKICLYAGLQRKMIVAIFVIACLVSYFLHRQFKKIMLLQLLLAILGFVMLVPSLVRQLNYSKTWMLQPDEIEQVQFQQKPNIYLLQPDGYVNFTELDQGHYKIDASDIKAFLASENFTNYDDFRSNYATTLSSNSATFAMKHHFYNRGANFGEVINARDNIVTKNPVLDILKNNGYKTHLITELPYLLMSRPKIGYDYCNYDYDNIQYLGTGLKEPRDISIPLAAEISKEIDVSKFFFLQMFNPGHISNTDEESEGVAGERMKWIESWTRANVKLKRMITMIKDKDPNALIVVMADHGGYVGLRYTRQIYEKIQDRDLVYSMFSSQLSIHWPQGTPRFEETLRTPVNLFRHIIAYVSAEEAYLEQLQEDATYIIINKNAPKGIYKYIDNTGTIVFDRVN